MTKTMSNCPKSKVCSECKGNGGVHAMLKNHGTGQMENHYISCPTCAGKSYTDCTDSIRNFGNEYACCEVGSKYVATRC